MKNEAMTSDDSRPKGRIWRSVGAIFAGFIFVVITHTGTDAIMHASGVFPKSGAAMTPALWWLAIAYRNIFSITGSYLTAKLAPQNPMEHALIGGAIGLVISIAGTIATWN